MGPFEYLLLFAAIILGLAVCDLATSLHRLLGAGARVRWDWLAPLAAVVAFLKIVTQWWTWFGVERIARGLTFEMFLGVLIGAVLLFLMAAAALPDEIHEGPVDLRVYYAGVSRRFWILFTLHWVLTTGISIWAQMQIEGARLSLASPVYLMIPLAISLAVIRNRWWHTICLTGLIVLYVGQFFGHALAG
ncbi:MAG TPA: hypothetical protein VHN39_18895 [Phenylobacterium sp.]|jgi:hypothetical protein|nr:hypothetical protein [Phenylobacterium sp.]